MNTAVHNLYLSKSTFLFGVFMACVIEACITQQDSLVTDSELGFKIKI